MTTLDKYKALRLALNAADTAMLELSNAINDVRRAMADIDTDGKHTERVVFRLDMVGPIHHGELSVEAAVGSGYIDSGAPKGASFDNVVREYMHRKEFDVLNKQMRIAYVPTPTPPSPPLPDATTEDTVF